jgi:hypothetical protein
MDALAIFDVVAAELTTTVDIGTVMASTSDDTQLRIYNPSDLYQAADVTLTFDGPNEGQLYLSTDGVHFTASINVGDIPPGAYSAIFVLRRVTHYMVGVGTYTATLVATPIAWVSPASNGSTDNIPLDTSDS